MSLDNTNDVMDLLASSFGTPGLLLDEEELGAKFFDLNTRLAGELFQKFMNYNTRLAVVVKDRTRYSKRFQELAYEHDHHASIRFFADRAAATTWLEKFQ